ncbi:MAG: hypothetical protein ACYC63_15585 [Armatimonadota bacterium]
MKPKLTLAALVVMANLLAPALSAAPIRTPLGDNYFALFDPQTKSLQCVSENAGRTWRVSVAQGVASQADWGGRSTSAGPVFVYGTSSGVQYVLLRYFDGSTNAEKSGESLRGTVSAGRLLSAAWVPAQYGAKATVVTLSGSTEYTTNVDINMWGTGKVLSQTSRTIQAKREKLPNAGLSFEVPPGFEASWDAGGGYMGVTATNKLPMGILLHAAEGGYDLSEFATEFMNIIGPGMGAPDMKQVLSDRVSVGSLPGLLRLAKCTWNGRPATFAFVFASNPQNTFVIVYGAPDVNYDQYAGIFYRLLSSIRFA